MTKRKWFALPLLLLSLALIAEGILMTAVFVTGAQARTVEPSDVIIVLGARVMPDGELSTTLLHRVEKAYEVYAEGGADKFILCGARGADEPETEAAAMAGYLRDKGVPAESLFLEDDSVNTDENLRNAKSIMDAQGMKKAILVTSDYHLTRALWLAEDAGLNATGAAAPGPDLLINRLKARARESLSWINYLVRHRLLGRVFR